MVITKFFEMGQFGPLSPLKDTNLTQEDRDTIKFLRRNKLTIWEVISMKNLQTDLEVTFKYIYCYDVIPQTKFYTDPDDPSVTWRFEPFSSYQNKEIINKWILQNKKLIKDLI